MAADMRALIEAASGPLPPRRDRYRVGELIAYCRTQAPALEAAAWDLALDHERRAMREASLESGALEALAGARRVGFATAIWTNNARALTLPALARLGLAGEVDLVVTRDDMRALKPDPDGWRVISGHFGDRLAGGAVVVGDSWVDGVAAAKAGVPFVAYRARQADLDRWRVKPIAHLTDLTRLPAWLAARGNGRR
jgi:phosphoglycolate phosphatase